MLDAVTAYMNVLANQALVDAQRANVAVLREVQPPRNGVSDAGDVTPTDTAQAEARLSRGSADLNAAEVALAISKATYTEVIGQPPSQLVAASTVDNFSPNALAAAREASTREHPAILGAAFDVDVAQTTIKVAESSLLPTGVGPGERQPGRRVGSDADHEPHGSGLGDRPTQCPDLRRRHRGFANPAGQGADVAEPHGARTGPKPDANRGRQRMGEQ